MSDMVNKRPQKIGKREFCFKKRGKMIILKVFLVMSIVLLILSFGVIVWATYHGGMPEVFDSGVLVFILSGITVMSIALTVSVTMDDNPKMKKDVHK